MQRRVADQIRAGLLHPRYPRSICLENDAEPFTQNH